MKKLIIVCEEKLRRYGDFLAQLISGTDDVDGKTVGIKDGTAAAQVWTEKEYSSNAAQISSEQYLLFVGNSKLIKEKRHHMQKKHSEYGMNYGWLGKQAVLFVDRTLSYSEYEEFYKIAVSEYKEGSQPEATRLLPIKADKETNAAEIIEAEAESSEITDTAPDVELPEKKAGKKLLVPFAAVKGVIKKTADTGKDTINKVANDINAAAKSKDIEEQQYTCLVLLFYLKDLGTFLGISEA